MAKPSMTDPDDVSTRPADEVECWENQRYVLFKGWGQYRLPTDRPLWSNRKGDRRHHLESFLLPMGTLWDGEWFIELPQGVGGAASPAPIGDNKGAGATRVTDPDSDYGWLYAPDFTVPTKYCSLKSSPIAIVRRRRWVRRFQKFDGSNANGDPELFSQPVYWTQCLFYGFSGDHDTNDVEAERQRHHESFHRLSRFCRKSTLAALHIGLASSIPSSVDDDEPQTPGTSPVTPLRVPVKTLNYVYRYGVAGCLRAEMWKLWTVGVINPQGSATGGGSPRGSDNRFSKLSLLASQTRDGTDAIEIAQDVVRTAPKHPLFDGKGSVGQLRLRNLLMTVALTPEVPSGYHQAYSYIAALFLLHMQPEDAYEVMLYTFHEILPPGYHEHYLLRHDLQIFSELLRVHYPMVDAAFQSRQIDISVFASGWLQGLFCAHFPFSSAARFFDVFFAEGNSTALVRVLLAFVKFHEKFLLTVDSSCTLGQFANNWARDQYDVQPLLDIVQDDKLAPFIAAQRVKLRASMPD